MNLATDLDDPVLGFASRWLREVALRVDRIEVITMMAGREELPDNVRVHSLGKELGRSEPRRAVAFYQYLLQVERRLRPNACFSHMAPIFSVMAAPVLVPRRVPIVTWYAHPKVTPTLRAAHAVSRRMVASAPESYRYRHDKLTVLSQGIDASLFSPGPDVNGPPYRLVSVGRLSPIKDPITMVRAISELRGSGHDVGLTLVGDAPTGQEAYVRSVRAEVAALGLNNHVLLAGSVPNHDAPQRHREAFAHLNAAPANHSLDKAVLEALACARPSITSTAGFRETLGPYADQLLFREGDPSGLAERVAGLIAMPAIEREEMSRTLRKRTVERHGLERLADRIVELLANEARDRPPATRSGRS